MLLIKAITIKDIVTTVDHPFYVNHCGFVNAGELKVRDELLDTNGNILLIEKIEVDLTDKPTTVYNFQVKDFHTYYVGENCVWVHNANYDVDIVSKNMKERISNDEIEPPKERGNAPISKKDGNPIEIHHDEQSPNGPFYEKARSDHRLGENYKKIIHITKIEAKLIGHTLLSKRKNTGRMSGIQEGGNDNGKLQVF